MDEQTKKEKLRIYMKDYQKKWRKRHIEKARAYDREWKRQYKLKHPDKVKKKRRERYYREKKSPEWVERRKAYMRSYLKKWRKDNEKQAKRHREWMRVWYKKNGKKIYERRYSKINERLARGIRSRIVSALRNGKKCKRTAELLGISIPELKIHLEGQFQMGMTWKNYGFYGWHIDHRLPLASFDLTKPEEQKKAFHYTNLQPLWAKENISKGAKIS